MHSTVSEYFTQKKMKKKKNEKNKGKIKGNLLRSRKIQIQDETSGKIYARMGMSFVSIWRQMKRRKKPRRRLCADL